MLSILSKRVAGGEIAAENTGLNGLPRASGNALAEYARRGDFPSKKSAYVSTY